MGYNITPILQTVNLFVLPIHYNCNCSHKMHSPLPPLQGLWTPQHPLSFHSLSSFHGKEEREWEDRGCCGVQNNPWNRPCNCGSGLCILWEQLQYWQYKNSLPLLSILPPSNTALPIPYLPHLAIPPYPFTSFPSIFQGSQQLTTKYQILSSYLCQQLTSIISPFSSDSSVFQSWQFQLYECFLVGLHFQSRHLANLFKITSTESLTRYFQLKIVYFNYFLRQVPIIHDCRKNYLMCYKLGLLLDKVKQQSTIHIIKDSTLPFFIHWKCLHHSLQVYNVWFIVCKQQTYHCQCSRER